jgi:hypothetical protein
MTARQDSVRRQDAVTDLRAMQTGRNVKREGSKDSSKRPGADVKSYKSAGSS